MRYGIDKGSVSKTAARLDLSRQLGTRRLVWVWKLLMRTVDTLYTGLAELPGIYPVAKATSKAVRWGSTWNKQSGPRIQPSKEISYRGRRST